jgi:hypothetical protein
MVAQSHWFSLDRPIQGTRRWLPAQITNTDEAKVLPVRGQWLLCTARSYLPLLCCILVLSQNSVRTGEHVSSALMKWTMHCRPGRLDKILYVPLPPPEGRGAILQALTRKTPLAVDVDVGAVGASPHCHGFSGADLAALVREACICALKVCTCPQAM